MGASFDSLTTSTGKVLLSIPGGSSTNWLSDDVCSRILRSILEDDDAFGSVLAGSIVHANGFTKVVAGQIGAARLRFHYWTSVVSDDPHGHRWDFVSRILAGAFEERFYDERESPEGTYLKHACGRSVADRDVFEVHNCGRAELLLTSTRDLAAGTVREVKSPGLHSFVPTSAPAATVVVTGRPYGRLSDLYLTESHDAEGPSAQPSRDALRTVVENLLGLVDSNLEGSVDASEQVS